MGTIRAINSGRYSWVKPYAKSALRQVADVARKYATKRVRDFTSTIFQPKKKPRKAPKRGFVTTGSYKGRFKGRRKRYPVKRVASKSKEYYAERGVTFDLETNGSISDANCVYLGHSSFSPYYLMQCTIQAILRQVFFRAFNWTPASVEEKIPANADLDNSTEFTLIFKSTNMQTAATTTVNYIFGLTESISTLSNQAAIQAFFITCSTGLSQKIQSISLVQTSLPKSTHVTLDLSTATISYFANSQLKVQNVTTPDTINLESTDVNNVPLVGRMYTLAKPYPDTQALSPLRLNWMNTDTGMITHVAGDLTSGGRNFNALKEPPSPGFFSGCRSSMKLRLEPGAIKMSSCRSSRSMDMHGFLQAISYNNTVSNNVTTLLGGSKVLALERVISVQGTLPIKLFYENNVSMGVHITFKPSKFTLGSFAQLNPPAIGAA